MEKLVFEIDTGGKYLSPERLEQYKATLNEIIGVDLKWEVITPEPQPGGGAAAEATAG